ncbi:methyltransferase domain-containing protein [uncultured Flavobacterium sp.]|uniref:methyltransferase domain-containing protein n=1 Tax=uncultured Flavobacterium sp. TaxID=165435 RepID=UPI00338F4336
MMNYWEERYQNNEIGWDVGAITTPLKDYIDQITDKSIRILIPGAGNGYEFDYLIKKGFFNVYVVDIAASPLKNIAERNPDFEGNLIHSDFFKINETFDLVIEQTFFCAIPPSMRAEYMTKMHQLLNKNGKIVGLLFDFPLSNEGPPFGGSADEYLNLFSEKFKIKILNKAYNSIKPRQDKELFFIFEKK